jgi:hypothetical protein
MISILLGEKEKLYKMSEAKGLGRSSTLLLTHSQLWKSTFLFTTIPCEL